MAVRSSFCALKQLNKHSRQCIGYPLNLTSITCVFRQMTSRRVSSHFTLHYPSSSVLTKQISINTFGSPSVNNLTRNCNPKYVLSFPTSHCYGTSVDKPEDDPNKSLSLYQRFKKMAKEYWYVLIPVHVVTSAFWLGGFYYLAVTGVDIVKLMELIGLPDSWVATMKGSKAGGIVTAYTLYKVATPARYTVTLGGTTLSINYLKRWGLIKPMPSQAELRTMYENKKEEIRDLKRSYSEKMAATTEEIKDEFKKTRDEISQHMTSAKSEMSGGFKDDIKDFKKGVSEAADEWRHVGKLVKQRTKELFDEDGGDKPIQAEFKGEVSKKSQNPCKGKGKKDEVKK